MADAPTPAPHVPAVFVLAGGAGLFDAACQALAMAAGYALDEFGTYDAVADKISASRDKVAAWDAMTPEEQAANPANRPSDHERWLAECESGHVSTNSLHQNVRGDVCSNPPSCRETYVSPTSASAARRTSPTSPAPGGGVYTRRVGPGCNGTPGYQDDQAMCMPHHGPSTQSGTGHHRITQAERAFRREQVAAGNTSISREDANAATAAMHQDLLVNHGNGNPPLGQPTTAGGATAGAPTVATGAVGQTSTVAPAGSTTPAEANPPIGASGATLAECIANASRAATDAMMDGTLEKRADHAAAAGTPAQREAALTRRQNADVELAAAEAATPPDETRLRNAQTEQRDATREHNRMQRAACMEEQAASMDSGGAFEGGPPPLRVPNTRRNGTTTTSPGFSAEQNEEV